MILSFEGGEVHQKLLKHPYHMIKKDNQGRLEVKIA